MIAIPFIFSIICVSFLKCHAAERDFGGNEGPVACLHYPAVMPNNNQQVTNDGLPPRSPKFKTSPTSVAEELVTDMENPQIVGLALKTAYAILRDFNLPQIREFNHSQIREFNLPQTSATLARSHRMKDSDSPPFSGILPLKTVPTAMPTLSRESSIATDSQSQGYSQEDTFKSRGVSPANTLLDDFLVQNLYANLTARKCIEDSCETLKSCAQRGNCLAKCAIAVLSQQEVRHPSDFKMTQEEIYEQAKEAYPSFLLYQKSFEDFNNWKTLLAQFLNKK